MKTGAICFLLLLSITLLVPVSTDNNAVHKCEARVLSQTGPPPRLTFEPAAILKDLINARIKKSNDEWNLTTVLLDRAVYRGYSPFGVILSDGTSGLELAWTTKSKRSRNSSNNVTAELILTRVFEATTMGMWSSPFRDCFHAANGWMQMYKGQWRNQTGAVIVQIVVDRCLERFDEVFGGKVKCDLETTICVGNIKYAIDNYQSESYWCTCKEGFYHPEANRTWLGFSGEEIENGLIDTYSCQTCPKHCDVCEKGGVCAARRDIYLKMAILGIQAACMGITIVLALVVFKQRKCKTIASGMWTILETILLGIFLLYLTVVVQFFEVSVVQCLLEPWAREMGFVLCYGAIVLKLYRHMIEFRTRKAHRWVVKDTDLLKYLLIMVASLFVYMAAYTSISLNFMQENYSLLQTRTTSTGMYYEVCKPLWWDYVTEIGEMTILVFGIHLGYASRNARTQFHERKFLCAAISMELAVSGLYYVGRVFVLPGLHPDTVLIANCLRTQLTATIAMALVFIPKFWYQQKQVRSLAQEYSCRLPVDAFKDVNAHGPLTGNNSDVDVGEVTLADMSPDDIRAELKRLYLQLEIFKSKTICRDNPHISKRRGGRKAQHRRFSLQNLYGKHRNQKQQAPASSQAAVELEITEAEPSRTPEDSVCSVEGTSNVYNDLQQAQPPQTTSSTIGVTTITNTSTSTTTHSNNTNNTSTSTVIN